jgi:serine/threonine-protein kinase RsbT
VSDEIHLPIVSQLDIVQARHRVRELSAKLRLSSSDVTLIATAVSELARNILEYATRGEMAISITEHGRRRGLVVIATDAGPGIVDVDRAMQDGFSTGKSLGLGLPGARRMMDEFQIVSEVGKGTTVTMKKWER